MIKVKHVSVINLTRFTVGSVESNKETRMMSPRAEIYNNNEDGDRSKRLVKVG